MGSEEGNREGERDSLGKESTKWKAKRVQERRGCRDYARDKEREIIEKKKEVARERARKSLWCEEVI